MAHKFREKFEEKGLTIADVIGRLYNEGLTVTSSTVYNWVNGKIISSPFLKPLSKILECDVEDLLM